ncbi:3'-5' exonuclease [Metabacillus sediminilitoris]|uniref:Exonuclease domain-containing protein n=1 Tax=Metabacillus sediminilitoris TaxID=2567941 RepID=A0A4S4C9E0_9BACI|nr:3'-5' exonuclease [Metabacillus sediminilitoris]QGQ45275.1 exonuclease [Metabacillus sediminilitoris]THF82426.1 exonuclease domain-containing protein [Metabacillus sediminilitoris]
MADIKQMIFFDFEMLCSDNGMAYDMMEAIRLGAVKYDLETESITYFDRYIRPENQEPLSDFCKALTGIDDQDLVGANDFATVFEEFLAWVGGIKKSQYFSWSPSDLTRLKIDAEKHEIPLRTITKIEKRYIDFQAVFKKRVANNNVSVEDALALYGLEFSGEKHHPMYDAYNTLRIYLQFLHEPVQSDLIMLKQFILEDELTSFEKEHLNQILAAHIKFDINLLVNQIRDVYRLRDVKKLFKPINRIVVKYENVIMNRSGIFTDENVRHAELLSTFYHELLQSYEEHVSYRSKIMILNEYLLRPLHVITSK